MFIEVESPNGISWFVGTLPNENTLLSLEKIKDLVSELHEANRQDHEPTERRITIDW